MANLNMRCRLYDEHHDVEPSTKPEWQGTLNEFWGENQDGYDWGEICEISNLLVHVGRYHFGGGAAAETTLFREDLHPDEDLAQLKAKRAHVS